MDPDEKHAHAYTHLLLEELLTRVIVHEQGVFNPWGKPAFDRFFELLRKASQDKSA